RGLLVDGSDDAARVAVEAQLRVDVADVLDRVARQLGDVDVTRRGDLTRHDHQAGGEERLAGDSTARVLGQDRIEYRVGNLVGDLVGVPLRHRLRREQMLSLRHANLLAVRSNASL